MGEDKKMSLKSVAAIVLTWKLVENLDYVVQKWEAGRPLGDISTIFFTLAGLIAALLGITAWSNMTAKKIDTEATIPASPTTIVQQAENVTTTGTTKAETVNTNSVGTVNTNTTNVKSDSNYIPPEGDA